MPTCIKCGIVGPTIEMRRLPRRFSVRERSGGLRSPMGLDEAQGLAHWINGTVEPLEALYTCKEKLACKRRQALSVEPVGMKASEKD